MKGKDIIEAAVRAEMPDMDALRNDCIRQAANKATMARSVWVKRLVPAAACAAIIIAAVFAVLQFSQNVPDDPLIDVNNTAIIGLPSATPAACDGQGVSADRIGFHRLQDLLFQIRTPRAIVFARVNEQTQPQSSEGGWLTQTSTLQVLSTVWGGDSEPPPQFLTVAQGFLDSGSGIMGCCVGSIPLRKGGVYFLPLGYNDGGWFIIGSEDVLFEVDDRGKLYSHSQFPDFNRFDDEEASVVADAILLLIEDENFAAATSRFGRNMRWNYEVAVVTYGESAGVHWEVSYNGAEFEMGVSYLALIADNNTVWDFYVTRVNHDGTITPSSESVFADLYGYTVDEVIAFAERARAWHAM